MKSPWLPSQRVHLGSVVRKLSAASLLAAAVLGTQAQANAETKPPVVRSYTQADLLRDIVADGRREREVYKGVESDWYTAVVYLKLPKAPFATDSSGFYEGDVTLTIKDVGADVASAARLSSDDDFQMSYNGNPACGNCFLETLDHGVDGFLSHEDSVMNKLFPGGGAWRGDSPDPEGKQYYELLLNAVLDARARGVPITPDR